MSTCGSLVPDVGPKASRALLRGFRSPVPFGQHPLSAGGSGLYSQARGAPPTSCELGCEQRLEHLFTWPLPLPLRSRVRRYLLRRVWTGPVHVDEQVRGRPGRTARGPTSTAAPMVPPDTIRHLICFLKNSFLKQIQNLKFGGNWTKPFLPSSGAPVWEEGIFKGSFCPGEFLDRPLEPQTHGSVKLRNVSLWVCSHSRSWGWWVVSTVRSEGPNHKAVPTVAHTWTARRRMCTRNNPWGVSVDLLVSVLKS